MAQSHHRHVQGSHSLSRCIWQGLHYPTHGTNHISNDVTGVSHFHHLAIQYAKQFPKICIITNSNMMQHERAISHMIIREDDPHYSDRGRQQMVSNLLYSMKQAQPALYEYADIVNNYYERSQ